MPCQEFEERLLDYDQLSASGREPVDLHLRGCAECSSFLAALDQVDGVLTAAFGARGVPPGFSDSVFQTLRKQAPLRQPSIIPEMLDALGWLSFVAIVLGLIMFFVPGLDFSTPLAVSVGMTLLTAGFWFAYRCYQDLRGY